MFTLYHDSPFALNLQAAFWLTCAHYIIRTYSHPSTHEPALSRSTALLRMAVRSLMAQEKNMSASQPHSFFCAHYITIRIFDAYRCWRSYRDRHSPFAINLQAAFWLTCAHYIIFSCITVQLFPAWFSQNICSQMCAQVTGFCRCFAFQIGKNLQPEL